MNTEEQRENVVRGLECIRDWAQFTVNHRWIVGGAAEKMVKYAEDALALLKAQEPRVMTLDEAKSIEGYAWLECCDRDVLSVSFFRGGFYIEPFERPLRADLMNWADYNKQWRYWTSCPTDEQREAVKWH